MIQIMPFMRRCLSAIRRNMFSVQRHRSERERLAYVVLVLSVAALWFLVPHYISSAGQRYAIVMPSIIILYCGWGVWRYWGREKFPLKDESRKS